ncbi:MAG: amino acid ABC transporter substrate-binding protein [Actinomycetota bacterium]|nr:amino acid ABC transporter substrate-binding protein [Actinomycetota bacterium]
MPRIRLVLAGLVVALFALTAVGCLHSDPQEEGGGGGGGDTAAQEDTAAGEEGGGGGGGSILQTVRDRGNLVCGVNDAVPGFGVATEAGDYEGFDIDFCRVVAAAVLGDADAVEFRPLTAEQRFTALQAGEIDVLIRNTTNTASRDGGEGARFLHTTYYDGQGMMVKAESEYQTLADLDGATICVLSGTTTELNLETVFRTEGLQYTPLTFEETDPLQQAFIEGRCDAWTSDLSQLAGIRSQWPANQGGPEGLRIFEEIMSKEPLGPAVRDGDDDWADAINWAIYATIQAEEFEITSDNVQGQRQSENPDVLRFLGQPVEAEEGAEPAPFDPGLDLEPDFAFQVVSQVGNYGEIFDRNVGAGSPLELDRGLNALWTDGGLQIAPPYR